MMKAMILAAGYGSRLKPLTDTTPKALVRVNSKPLLEHLILRLKAVGCTHLVINIHHLGQQIIDFLRANDDFGLKIDISDERDYLADTGGGIKQAARFLDGDEPFLVHNVDIFSGADLRAMYLDHAASDAVATLLVNQRPASRRRLLFDRNDRLCGWRNSETGEIKSFDPNFDLARCVEQAFGGIHVMSPRIFRRMDDWPDKFSIIDFYLTICPQMPIRAYRAEGVLWMDCGTPESLAAAERLSL
jgi:NDP-sugar pyrophosphorylase family protein